MVHSWLEWGCTCVRTLSCFSSISLGNCKISQYSCHQFIGRSFFHVSKVSLNKMLPAAAAAFLFFFFSGLASLPACQPVCQSVPFSRSLLYHCMGDGEKNENNMQSLARTKLLYSLACCNTCRS